MSCTVKVVHATSYCMAALLRRLCVVVLLCSSGLVMASGSSADNKTQDIIADAEALEAQVLKLNRELFMLEQDLLYPPDTQVSVFLSWDGGLFFDLDSVELKINGETVATHLYTDLQRQALRRGGLQELYRGNLKAGEHEVTAVITGLDKERDKQLRTIRRAASLNAVKDDSGLRLELSIEDDPAVQQPRVSIVQWTDA